MFKRKITNEDAPKDIVVETDIDLEMERLSAIKKDLNEERTKGSIAEFMEAADNYGLSFLKEATFFDQEGKLVFKLSELIPEGYLIVEGAPLGRDFMNQHYKYIVLEEDFLQSVIGRFFALHEISHARDFTEHPLTEDKELSSDEDELQLVREGQAWKLAKGIIEDLKKKGMTWLPDSFLDSGEFERVVNFCLDYHKSLIKKV